MFCLIVRATGFARSLAGQLPFWRVGSPTDGVHYRNSNQLGAVVSLDTPSRRERPKLSASNNVWPSRSPMLGHPEVATPCVTSQVIAQVACAKNSSPLFCLSPPELWWRGGEWTWQLVTLGARLVWGLDGYTFSFSCGPPQIMSRVLFSLFWKKCSSLNGRSGRNHNKRFSEWLERGHYGSLWKWLICAEGFCETRQLLALRNSFVDVFANLYASRTVFKRDFV